MSLPRTFNNNAFGVVAVFLLLALSGCGGGEDSAATGTSIADAAPTTGSVATAVSTTAVSTTEAPTTAVSESATTTVAASPETTAVPRPYGSFELTAAEPGSNPLLAWEAVDGAALYRLVVLDDDGEPYWAWSGTDTALPLGGSAEPTVVGARVFTDMTWQVSAHDAAGLPIAVSDVGALSP